MGALPVRHIFSSDNFQFENSLNGKAREAYPPPTHTLSHWCNLERSSLLFISHPSNPNPGRRTRREFDGGNSDEKKEKKK